MILVDTSAWFAVSDPSDGNHRRALREHRELLGGKRGRLLTTDFILDETLTLTFRRLGLEAARAFSNGIERSRSVQTVWITPAHYQAALDLFLGQDRTRWSFTDCTSFAIMRELGLRHAFSFGADFREAGFEVLPT